MTYNLYNIIQLDVLVFFYSIEILQFLLSILLKYSKILKLIVHFICKGVITYTTLCIFHPSNLNIIFHDIVFHVLRCKTDELNMRLCAFFGSKNNSKRFPTIINFAELTIIL